jgi:cytoskeletal protein CcmA (bactofilin family)
MFRRKEEDSLFDNQTEDQTTSDAAAASSASSSGAPVPPQGSRFANESRPASSTTQQSGNSGSSFRPSSALPADITRNRMPEAKSAPASTPVSIPAVSERSGKTIRRVLTVGSDILLKGEIATCDRLVIEGKVDATLNDVHTVEITETGSFKGSAQIEDAEISGLFEGDLVVRGRLVIYGSGKVRGTITYGEIEIERGGEISGEIKCGNAQSVPATTRSRNKEAVAA